MLQKTMLQNSVSLVPMKGKFIVSSNQGVELQTVIALPLSLYMTSPVLSLLFTTITPIIASSKARQLK
jgi:hypothetical protein